MSGVLRLFNIGQATRQPPEMRARHVPDMRPTRLLQETRYSPGGDKETRAACSTDFIHRSINQVMKSCPAGDELYVRARLN